MDNRVTCLVDNVIVFQDRTEACNVKADWADFAISENLVCTFSCCRMAPITFV